MHARQNRVQSAASIGGAFPPDAAHSPFLFWQGRMFRPPRENGVDFLQNILRQFFVCRRRPLPDLHRRTRAGDERSHRQARKSVR